MAHSSSASSPHDAVGIALTSAVSSLRDQLGDPFAPIAVVVPAGPNTVLARTALAVRGPFEQLLRGLASARADAGFVTDADITRAALAHIDDDNDGVGAARGAIVLGDRELTWPVHDFMTAWLARRLVVHVRVPALSTVPTATLGLVGALGAHTVINVEPATPPRLRAVQLGRSDDEAAADRVDDTSVEIARTPDDVREAVECVREVKRAIRAGTALDRIAIVLTDGRQRGP